MLKDFIEYKADTGEFFHRKTRSRRFKSGMRAGTICNGYVVITVNRKRYYGHRLAWYLSHGEMPVDMIDHINGVKDDNRICNLRVSTMRKNQSNQVRHRNGRLVGTKFVKKNNTWTAAIRINKVQYYLGCFKTEADAHGAYLNKLKEVEE